MKLAAAHAIAALAREPVPAAVRELYGEKNMKFGPDYILPKPFDRRLLTTVPPAVAQAAAESGVARNPIADLERYGKTLKRYVTDSDAHMKEYLSAQAS